MAARRSGRTRPDEPNASKSPRTGTLRNELQALSTVCNWAGIKVEGERLLARNPVSDIALPTEKNPKRPTASPGRFRKLLEISDLADDQGQSRAMLVLAWHTGRRVGAICHLRASDVLLGPNRVRAGLAGMGKDESWAEEWSNAIRWRGEFDKLGYEDISPIGPTVIRELESYLSRSRRLGEAWLFTMDKDSTRAQTNVGAGNQLRRAEKLAGLPKIDRGVE